MARGPARFKHQPYARQTVTLTLASSPNYTATTSTAQITIAGNCSPIRSITAGVSGISLSWAAVPNGIYQVLCKDNLDQENWIVLSPQLTATGATLSWTDPTIPRPPQRFYRILQVR